MKLRILGPLDVVADGQAVRIGGPRERIVLAMLALRANRVTSVEQLVDAVWGELPPSTARAQIQSCISGLRKVLDDAGLPDAIQTRAGGYLLTVAEDRLDSEKFGKLVAQAHRQVAEQRLPEAAATLREALGLWRGPALSGVQSDLVQRGCAVLEDARIAAVEELMRLDLQLGRHAEISGELRVLVAEHPLRERLYEFLVLALYRSGRQAEALEVCRRARVTMISELGLEPRQELQTLERAVLNRDPSLGLPSESGQPANPAEKPLSSPRQLPSSIADFIGRQSQIVEVSQLLAEARSSGTPSYAVPIIGIVGFGGVGKSTLALRVAHESAEEYSDGHLYVDLTGEGGEDRIASVLARFLRALGVNATAIPDSLEERAGMYRSRVANKRLLLVIDNVSAEHEIEPLLPGSPTCAVIVTSRTRLDRLAGARWISLSAFDSETAIQLLAKIVGWERLQAEPAAVQQLVEYCGGLPLALRIAGARLASRPHWRIGELTRRLKSEVQRLDELSHRGLEIRSSIGLSYRTLPEQAKRLFRLIALPQARDFPSWSAAALLNCSLKEAEETLERLVDVQLLSIGEAADGETRYCFHDLIRVYAGERLLDTDPEPDRRAALRRLLGGWLALAEEAHRTEYGGDYTILHGTAERFRLPEWSDHGADNPRPWLANPLEWLEKERGSLVSAVRSATAADEDELSWDLALSMVSLFEVRGYFDDWRETAELAYAVCVRAGNATGRAAMRYSQGTLAMFQKQLSAAQELFGQALEIFSADENVHGQALVLRNAAIVDRLLGNFDSMLGKYEEALAKMRTVGDVIGQANILRNLSKYRIDQGDIEEAAQMLSEALQLCQQVNYVRGEAQVASRFAELYLSTGQPALARQTLNRVLESVRQIGDRIGEAHALYGLGIVRRREGRLDTAEATLLHALSVAEEVSDRLIQGQAHYAIGELCLARGENAKAAEHLQRARELFDELGSSLWLAKTLIQLLEAGGTDGATPDVDDIDRVTEVLSNSDSKEAGRLLRSLAEVRSALASVQASAGISWMPRSSRFYPAEEQRLPRTS
ncbi:MAG: BTAD domain-containing putative transcriptional regulator [Jatrophihabitantaceae bacterium]